MNSPFQDSCLAIVEMLMTAGEPRLTAAVPMDNPYCSCSYSRGLQLQSLWIIPTAAAG